MLTAYLVSLPPETLRQLAEVEWARERAGGSLFERRADLFILAAIFALPLLLDLMTH